MTPTLLTPEQRAIVTSRARAILIGAVAGSGKTTTLAQCVAHRERGGVPAASILVLVFTTAAEEVFRDRLAQAGASRHVRVQTYAAFARGLLESWAASGLIDGAAEHLPDAQAMRPHLYDAIEEASTRSPDPDYRYDLTSEHVESVIDHLSRLKGTLDLLQFEDDGDAGIAETLDLPRGLVGVCRQVERLRNVDLGTYAFESEPDYVYDVLQLADQLPAQLVWPAFGLIVADEWHDANAGHIRLLRKLAGEDTQVIAAGDREQVVHTWNGADPRFMGEAFLALFPETRRLPLSRSFRCGPTLSASAQHLSGQVFSSARIQDTDVIEVPWQGDDPMDCARGVVQAVQSLARDARDATLSDVAVLLRDTHQSIPIENALIDAGIAYRVEGFASYFGRLEILMLRGLLHIVTGTIAPVSHPKRVEAILRALGRFADVDITRYLDRKDDGDEDRADREKLGAVDKEWAKAARELLAFPMMLEGFYQNWLAPASDGRSAADEGRRWRAQFKQVCDFLIGKADVWTAGEILAHASRELRVSDMTRRLFVYRREAQVIARSIDGFVAYAQETGLSAGAFLARLEEAQAQAEQLKKHQHALTLATARHAKGKEWKHVLLPYLANGEFPDTRNEPGEERRLFYVAITRASASVRLFVPRHQTNAFVQMLSLEDARRIGAENLRDNLAAAADAPATPARIYLNVPFGEKDAAKALGAQWDGVARKWWISAAMPTRPFKRWMAAE
jgi:DNA helicase-2/ATP-dependent DNA helicase PcrA